MYYQCPYCKKRFPYKYKCQTWKRPVREFLGAAGYARANFDKHKEKCKIKNTQKD